MLLQNDNNKLRQSSGAKFSSGCISLISHKTKSICGTRKSWLLSKVHLEDSLRCLDLTNNHPWLDLLKSKLINMILDKNNTRGTTDTWAERFCQINLSKTNIDFIILTKHLKGQLKPSFDKVILPKSFRTDNFWIK